MPNPSYYDVETLKGMGKAAVEVIAITSNNTNTLMNIFSLGSENEIFNLFNNPHASDDFFIATLNENKMKEFHGFIIYLIRRKLSQRLFSAIYKFAKHDSKVRRVDLVIRNEVCPLPILRNCAEKGDDSLIRGVIRNKNTSSDIIKIIYDRLSMQNIKHGLEREIAYHPNCPDEIKFLLNLGS